MAVPVEEVESVAEKAIESNGDSEDRALDLRKFLGFFPEKLYEDLYGLGYNEFLKAAASIKETLVSQFPGNKELIEKYCSEMLEHFTEEYERFWFEPFTRYCSQNVFVLPPSLDVWGQEETLEHRELQEKLLAQEVNHSQLVENLARTEEEIARKRALYDKLSRTEELVAVTKQCQALDERVRKARLVES